MGRNVENTGLLPLRRFSRFFFGTDQQADTPDVLRANNQQAGVHQMTTFQVTKIVAPYSKIPSTKVLGTVQANTSSMARIIAYDKFRQGWNARLIVTKQK